MLVCTRPPTTLLNLICTAMEIEENKAYSLTALNPSYIEDQVYEPVTDRQEVKDNETSEENNSSQPSPLPSSPKRKVKKGIFDCLSILALALALVAVVLCVALLTTVHQSSQTLQQQRQLFEQQISNVADILNSSLLALKLQVENSSQATEASLSNSTQAIEQLQIALTHTNQQVEDAITNLTKQDDFIQNLEVCVDNSIKSDPCSSKENISALYLACRLNKLEATVQAALEKNVVKIGSLENPATSCNDILQNRPSGLYWIQTNCTSPPSQVYCDTNPRNFSNNTRGWMKVAHIDMTDSTQSCPDRFRQINRSEPPLRICGRPDGLVGCAGTIFPVHGIEYSHVCGRITGYQFGSPAGFYGYNELSQNIDGYYISGASLTHGRSPRQHIWSFVNALSDGGVGYNSHVCPCSRSSGDYAGKVPPFVGEDYYCDSGTDLTGMFLRDQLYPDDPLWDGQGCDLESTCCIPNKLPWFCKKLPEPTTDDIELRLCDNNMPKFGDSPFEVVELYVN